MNEIQINKALIIDLETDSVDVEHCVIRVFGALDYQTGKYYIMKWDEKTKEEVTRLLENYDILITFNGKEFDMPILERHGIRNYKYKQHLDVFNIFKYKRPFLIKGEHYSMRAIVKELKIDEEGKGEIDYKIFQKQEWTKQDKEEIVKYLKQDLLLTKKLWDYLKDKFRFWADYIKPEDAIRYRHINSTVGGYAYQVVCTFANLPEEYNHDVIAERFKGAYVSKPFKEYVRGLVVHFDYGSLYPNTFAQFNLYSNNCKCCKQDEKWHGNEMFHVEGYYCKKKQGPVEQAIKTLYLLRLKLKKEGKRDEEQALKTTLNTMYGITGNPVFKSVYNLDTAGDCTSLGQQQIKYAIKRFDESGFISLYTDTDSIFVEVPEGKTQEECIELSIKIIDEMQKYMSFPW